ncbi:hypothetical protein [Azotobacter chroococcum]|uniref:hypothetical protein n=1 Tax=Azotobacter chroococcum TaxID=353 RepID=UPI0010AEC48D|nr:hypothetical protein [Azotobacter chroococcum]TKD44164.1 hypothetical protein FCG41_07145 [Azotobacter chroococcum]
MDTANEPLSNPFFADEDGLIQFAAPNGRYDLRTAQGGLDYRVGVQCNDVDDAIAAAAAEVAAIKTEIRNWYYGPLAEDPLTRPDGTDMEEGDEYHNTVNHSRRVFMQGVWTAFTGASTANLANATDPTKGGGMSAFSHAVNYPEGTMGAHARGIVSVKDAPFRAMGNGINDDTSAFQALVGFESIVIPPGTYKITSSIDLSATEIAFQKGAKLSISAGAVVTLGYLKAGLHQIFAGSGEVTVTSRSDYIFPEWWGAKNDFGATDSYQALQATLNVSMVQRNVVKLSGNYGIGTRLSIAAETQIISDRRSTLRPASGSGLQNGVLFLPGNALGRTTLPSLALFSGVAIEIRCNLADIYVPQLNTCGTAILIHTAGSAAAGKASVLDSIVRFDAVSACQNVAIFRSDYSLDVIQGVGVYGNFITNTINSVIFDGVAAYNDGLILDVLAIDFVTGGGAVLDNRTNEPVPRFTAKVRSWLGGNGFVDTSLPTQLAKGRWDHAELDFVNAASFDERHLGSNLIRASRILMRRGNQKQFPVNLVKLSTGKSGFNNGRMIYNPRFLGAITLVADLAAESTTSYYFWHIFADANYYGWKAQLADGADGMVIITTCHDQSATENGRVAVVIKNIGTVAIQSGTVMYLYVEKE